MEHAELVAPGVAHDPEVKAALLLMVIAGRAQRLQALDLGLNIVGLQVEVHPFLGDLLVVGALEQDPDLGVRESEWDAGTLPSCICVRSRTLWSSTA